MQHRRHIKLAALCSLCCMAFAATTHSEEKTAYRETPLEKANHEVVANFSRTLFQDPDKAAELYLDEHYVEHSHLVQMVMKKAQTGREDTVWFFKNQAGMGAGGASQGAPGMSAGGPPPNAGMEAGAPPMDIGQIRVNDEMVTQYGPEGVDIFRVVNGKITDHWDASPMEPVKLVGENHIGNDAPAASKK